MYKKTIKRGNNSYSYYYHNHRVNGKVRNVFLGTSLKEAKIKLNKFNNQNSFDAPIPNRIPSINSGAILTIMFLLLLGIGLYALDPDSITGLVTEEVIQQPTIIIEPEVPEEPAETPEQPAEAPQQESQEQEGSGEIQQPVIIDLPKQTESEESVVQQPQIIEEPKKDFAIPQPQIIENISIFKPGLLQAGENLTHSFAEINKPAVWTKEVKLANLTNNYNLILPKDAYNININKQIGSQEIKVSNIVTPLTTFSDSNKSVIIKEPVQNLTVTYEAPGPSLIENKTENGIKVEVSSNLPYENVLSYVNHNLSGNIRLIHENIANLDVTDNVNYSVIINENNITWTVPHLSTQYFFITNDTANQPPTSTTKFGKWTNGTFLNVSLAEGFDNSGENVTLNRTGSWENRTAGFTNPNLSASNPSLTFDSSDGTIWIMDNADNFVYHHYKDGTFINEGISSPGVGGNPFGIAYDKRNDTLWIISYTAKDLEHINASGGADLSGTFSMNEAGVGDPEGGVAIDPRNGTFWVVDTTDGFIYHFN